MTDNNTSTFEATIAALTESETPLLIGVRHHSAALARVLPHLLDDFGPEAVLVELPGDLSDWLPFLADSETIAPVALSAAGADGGLFFYPLADFSPELVAIRWAFANEVPVIACDLPVVAKHVQLPDEPADPRSAQCQPAETTAAEACEGRLLHELLSRTGASDTGQLWERLVETPAVSQEAQAIRRAALLFGWAVRCADQAQESSNVRREAAMRQAVRTAPKHSVAVVGSFHAAALLPDVIDRESDDDAQLLETIDAATEPPATSLVSYSFEQLDERSGYPAGIRDPRWHQKVTESQTVEQIDRMSVDLITDICRQLRMEGHVAGTPDATEIARMMRDLARMRALPVGGRGELIESLQSCLVQGELLGRGRAVARAAEAVLVGDRRGQVTSAAPKCGLAVHLEELLASLNLPGPASDGDDPREIRLDVLRQARDRARAVVLRRMCIAQITYASRVDTVETGSRENLTERWKVQWQHATAALIAAAARHGVTLEQVTEAVIRKRLPGDTEAKDEVRPECVVDALRTAAECGLPSLVNELLVGIDHSFIQIANMSQLVGAASWIGRIAAGHVPGLPTDAAHEFRPVIRVYHLPSDVPTIGPLLGACLDRLTGLEGSDRAGDVAGLVDLVYWFTGDLLAAGDESPGGLLPSLAEIQSGTERMKSWCRLTAERGSDRMRGAAIGVLGVLGAWEVDQFNDLTSGWFDGAGNHEGRNRLRYGLAGAIQVLLSLAQNDLSWLEGLENRFRVASDELFLARLPALRGGFSELSPADRKRLLELRLAGYQERGTAIDNSSISEPRAGANREDPTLQLAARRTADLAGRSAVNELFPHMLALQVDECGEEESEQKRKSTQDTTEQKLPPDAISLADRWRLVLAVTGAESPKACAAASCLDQLYGYGKGEGAGDRLSPGRGVQPRGGVEAPEPTALQWADDLEDLFGGDVCQEVLGAAAEQGSVGAAELLDPDQVQPSIELLKQVLSLAGGLPESRAEKLRSLARRVTEQLAQELANRLRPALTGLSTPRPSRRRSRRLNLGLTLRDNLANAYRRSDGRTAVIAERLIFNSPARREMDWHLTFVVDVSGSMSASVVYSALVAAIFAELPAITVRFIAFSTEVIDLSGKVVDPLALLLEVQVGGGTHIGLGLRAARSGIKLPSRSLVVLVSDFEEGVSVGEMVGEVRALVDAGVKCIGLAALDDTGSARFHQGYAQVVANAGMPVAAVSPENLARWVGEQIRG